MRVNEEDHPRVCGEKNDMTPAPAPSPGSPPRVRGKVHALSLIPRLRRITPACAGKSGIAPASSFAMPDHPRVCGEKSPVVSLISARGGSPPRVRGKDSAEIRCVGRPGITPACAGKSAFLRRVTEVYQDHPRVCGEKAAMIWSLLATAGSPPRVRGKGPFRPFRLFRRGITPACAGKSQIFDGVGQLVEDHPRVCGEKYFHSSPNPPYRGSPPRVRGKDRYQYSYAGDCGITPACAGKSARPGRG